MRGNQRRKMSIVAAALSFIMLLSVSCSNKSDAFVTEIQRGGAQESALAQAGRLQVHFIDVGQGDATLIICDGHAMLFDAGENDQGAFLQLYLMEQGIDRLDYVIGSHPESDHIGGMDVILLKYDCGTIMLPEVEADTTTYRDLSDAMKYKNYKATVPKVGEIYGLGDASFTIIAPNRDDYGEDMNNYSIGIKLVYGDNAFIFTGDGEAGAEEEMLRNGISLDADVLKAGHHGSHDASSVEFVRAVSPEYAVISCGKGNEYGHPHKETLSVLEDAGAEIFRTDELGSIIAISDGTHITWNSKSEEVWQEVYYVGNKNNRKLHRSTCNSLPKAWNQVLFASKEEAVNAGFTDLCGGCRP